MAYVCQTCGLVRTMPKRYCVRCKSTNIRATSSPFAQGHNFSADDDGMPPPPANMTDGNPDETPTSELTP